MVSSNDSTFNVELPCRVAAICYRRSDTGIEFLLVKTSDGQRWTFPKGHIEKGESPEKAAAREAMEEAGVSGDIGTKPFIEYSFPLESVNSGTEKERVNAFLLEVTAETKQGEPRREPTWFETQKAKEKLAEYREPKFTAEHHRVIDAAVRALDQLSD